MGTSKHLERNDNGAHSRTLPEVVRLVAARDLTVEVVPKALHRPVPRAKDLRESLVVQPDVYD